MELIRPEYWNGWPFPSPGDLSTLGLNPGLLHCRWISLSAEPPGKPKNTGVGSLSLLQRIFPTQESNQGPVHCRWILYPTELSGKPRVVRVARISGVEYWKRVKFTETEMEMGGGGGYSED